MKETTTASRQENYSAPEIEEIIVDIRPSVLTDSEPAGGGETGGDGGDL